MTLDPITISIINAIAAGALTGSAEVASQAIVDGYSVLKTLIRNKYGEDNDISKAVDQLEKEPESEGRKLILSEKVAAVQADKDDDILKLAESLVSALANNSPNISITGNDNIVGNDNKVEKNTQTAGDNSTLIVGSTENKIKNRPFKKN